jgi:GMP synthase (glutamine-hydrolysing)
MRVLAVINHLDLGPGVFADEVVADGHEVEEWVPSRGPLPRPLEDYDALIAFGGLAPADREDRYPWLLSVFDVLGAALGTGLPTLGVCLGAQLLARVAGGTVLPAPSAEWGWQRVALTRHAAADSLLGALPTEPQVFQWHFDQFTLPPGSVALALSPVSPQAFRVGSAAWGLQWHPEVRAETVLLWAERHPPAPGGVPVRIDVDRLRADTRRNIEDTNRDGRRLCARFLEIASDRAGDHDHDRDRDRAGDHDRPQGWSSR